MAMLKKSMGMQIVIALVMLGGIAFLLSLGNWQIARLEWKENLIQQIAARSSLAPQELDSAAIAQNPDAANYTPVQITGRFLSEKEAYLYTILSEQKGAISGPGWLIITPFLRTTGETVLVNRGFVPVPQMQDKAAWALQEQSELTLTGIVQTSEPRGMFAAEDNTTTREFYTRDPAAIAKALGVDAPAFILDRKADGAPALPQAGKTVVELKNPHLAYAFTWYGLAGTLGGFFLLWIGAKIKSGRDKRQENR